MDENQFEAVALEIFRYQSESNPVYRQFIENLGLDRNQITQIHHIPFLPIELFKYRRVVTGEWQPEVVFTSSGTGKVEKSMHYVRKVAHYRQVSQKIFENFYGSPERYHILALLPSYLERTGSSLVYMLNQFIEASGSECSGFYLRDYQRLIDQLNELKNGNPRKHRKNMKRKVMLWGVTFALLELAKNHKVDLSEVLIIETGGMKGHGEEMVREDLHHRLSTALNCKEIQSEYGMAELTSQAYTVHGRFETPPWMKVMIRDITDPFKYLPNGRAGGINVIDLANIHSCAFIETQDLGNVQDDGSFTVLGRLDNSDVRGCNLLV